MTKVKINLTISDHVFVTINFPLNTGNQLFLLKERFEVVLCISCSNKQKIGHDHMYFEGVGKQEMCLTVIEPNVSRPADNNDLQTIICATYN